VILYSTLQLVSPRQPQDPGQDRRSRRRGATAMEYLFVASLILVACITAIGYFGQETKNTTQKANDAIQKAVSGK
jgi:Flp pilus assembly pilin Flp